LFIHGRIDCFAGKDECKDEQDHVERENGFVSERGKEGCKDWQDQAHLSFFDSICLNQERKDVRMSRIMLKEKIGSFLNQERKDTKIDRIEHTYLFSIAFV